MLSSIITIIYALIIFSVIIFIHEFGHFIMAKLFDVYVIEFAIGMGPAIYKKQVGETLYAIRAIPMGGYCKLEGEDEESDSPRAFIRKGKLQRFLILFSGAFMNLVLGFAVMLILIGAYGSESGFVSTTIDTVNEGMPAYTAGILPGDRITKINGNNVNIKTDYNMYSNNKDNLNIEVQRQTGNKPETLTFNVTPKSYIINEEGQIVKEGTGEGATKLIGIAFRAEQKNFINVFKHSYYESVLLSKMIVISVKDLIVGNIEVKSLAGPIGIVKEINTAAKSGLEDILFLMALITINLGVFNLLPIPALDGGRILFILIEAIIRKPIPAKYEGLCHTIGFALLIMLMLYVTGNDLLRIFKIT